MSDINKHNSFYLKKKRNENHSLALTRSPITRDTSFITAVPLEGSIAPNTHASRWLPSNTYLSKMNSPSSFRVLWNKLTTAWWINKFSPGSTSPRINPNTLYVFLRTFLVDIRILIFLKYFNFLINRISHIGLIRTKGYQKVRTLMRWNQYLQIKQQN